MFYGAEEEIMPTFSQYVSNIPDGETIITSIAGKLAVNKGDRSLKYGSYGGETNKVYSPLVPIGCILAWAKSITGVPALPDSFVECSGQVLSDAESLLDGQTMPDLNGATTKRFLRGSTTSGTTGGSETHAHSHNHQLVSSGDVGFSLSGGSRTTTTDATAASTLPSYYEVVWIIRIK